MKLNIPIRPFRIERFVVEVQQQPTNTEPLRRRRLTTRFKTACCALGIVTLLVSCTSSPLALAPVGPGPYAHSASVSGMGDLEVYTEHEVFYEDQMPYFPHSDYHIYTTDGKHLRRVWNHSTHEDESPATVSLRPGRYIVEAWAEFYGLVTVPVVIRANELTKVVLQPGWNPGAKAVSTDLVQMPQGYFVGYRDR